MAHLPARRVVVDCTVVAILKVLIYHPVPNAADIAAAVLAKWLPISDDLDEGVSLLRLFCFMVQTNHFLLKDPRIAEIVQQTLHNEAFLKSLDPQEDGPRTVEEFRRGFNL